MSVFTLPDLGEGLHEAEIVTWHVAEGDHVVTDQPLVSVETDKAVVEIPSPHSARVTRLRAEPGARVTVGQPLVEFEAVSAAADTGTVVGDIGDATATRPATPVTPTGGGRATPAVRALARQLGVNLSVVQGTGPDGAATKQDVERAAGVLAGAPEAEPLRGVRRAMATRMARAHAEVPRATVNDEADVSAWTDHTAVMPRLLRALVAGCREAPALNAWFDPDTMARRLHDRVDVGIAVDTGDGLFVPVLRDVGNREPADLEAGLDRLKDAVRTRRVPPDELRGQTITLSNFGAVGGRFAELVVVPPQVAILGVGRRREAVVPIEGTPVVHPVIPLSLTFDHRAATGAEAARFLRAAIDDLEKTA